MTKIVTFLIALIFSQSLIAALSDDFVIQVKTDNEGVSTDTQFTIPTTGSGYQYHVDCNNDGLNEAINLTGNYTCNYAVAGTYTIRIKHNLLTGLGFPRIYFANGTNDNLKVVSLDQWGTGHWTSMRRAFWRTMNMQTPATDSPNLTSVPSMNLSGMFYGACIANPDTSNWDTTNVSDMSFMFSAYACFPIGNEVANPNTSNWVTTNVTSMQEMFAYQRIADPDTSGWNTGMVTNLQAMFSDATMANPDTSSWNVESVDNMSGMFFNASSANPDTSSWDISMVDTMASFLRGVTIPTVDYDAMLIGFNNQSLLDNVSFHGGFSQYCSANAQGARAKIIADHTWNIADGGLCAPSFVPDLTTATDSGVSQTDNITNDTTPEFIVQCSVIGNTLRLYSNKPNINTLLETHVCVGVGNESVAIGSSMAVGLQNITYTEQPLLDSPSGHSASLAITIDNIAPVTPGCSTTPNLANNGTAVITTCDAVEVGTVLTIDNMSCPSPTGATGSVACSGVVNTGVGQISVSNDTVNIIDLAGNINSAATTGLVIDNLAPTGPGSLSAPVSLTNDTNDDIIGSCGSDAANGTVVVTSLPVDGFTQWYGVGVSLDNNGGFVIVDPNWSEGIYELTFNCEDEVGNGPSAFGLFGPIEIDLTIDTPIINPIATTYLEITGTAEPFATLAFSNASCTNSPINVDQNGNWSCEISVGLDVGVVVNVVATDLAGNVSANATSTVLAVNVAPSFDVFCDIDATDVTGGKNTTIVFPGFIHSMLVGPENESKQTFDLYLSTVTNGDPDLIIDSMDLHQSGTLGLNINVNNSGVATVEVTMIDSGGTQVGGVDTTILEFNIHNYADLNLDPRYIDLDLNDMVYKNSFDPCR